MAISTTLLSSAATVPIFIANTGTEYAITTIIFCNTAELDDAELNLFAVPNGGVPSQATQILKSVKIPAGETFVMDSEKLILSGGDKIFAKIDPLAVGDIVCATVSSVQI